jgi:small subunit ribosomal protein S2
MNIIFNTINIFLHFRVPQILSSGEERYTKKELLKFNKKKEKLEQEIGGVRNLGGLPNVLFVIDVKTHTIAIKEAKKLHIPIFGVVDTNSSTDGIDFIIPGNDDSRKSIDLYCNLVSNAILSVIKSKLSSEGVDLKRISDDKSLYQKS